MCCCAEERNRVISAIRHQDSRTAFTLLKVQAAVNSAAKRPPGKPNLLTRQIAQVSSVTFFAGLKTPISTLRGSNKTLTTGLPDKAGVDFSGL